MEDINNETCLYEKREFENGVVKFVPRQDFSKKTKLYTKNIDDQNNEYYSEYEMNDFNNYEKKIQLPYDISNKDVKAAKIFFWLNIVLTIIGFSFLYVRKFEPKIFERI